MRRRGVTIQRATACIGMCSVNQSLELPSSGCPRNGCILFLLLKLKKKKEKRKSLYDLEKLSIARTNKQLPGQDSCTGVKRHCYLPSSFALPEDS